jgi:hypothetical protein
MIRYCETAKSKIIPCNVGLGSCSDLDYHFCHDEPKEENCRYLVDDTDIQFCPTCGTALNKGKIK